MNSLRNYFVSPTKNTENVSPEKVEKAEDNIPPVEEIKVSSILKEKGKLIVKNMEEVIGSVKKKRKYHRHHYHHKENTSNKTAEHDIANISNTLSTSLSIISPNISHEEHNTQFSPKNTVQPRMRKKEKPKQSNSAKENNRKSGQKSSETKESTKQNTSTMGAENVQRRKVAVTKVNAFDVMMNARNKSIGSNSPGKDVSSRDENAAMINDEVKEKNAKRKLALENWAERKGGRKRKLLEESREEYIEVQMKKRAKRLKRMLTGKQTRKSKSPASKMVSGQESEEKNSSVPLDKTVKEKQLSSENKKENPGKSKGNAGKDKKRHSKNIAESSSVSNKSIDNDEFLSKLSSPIKKRDSLLGYFEKINSPPSELNSSIVEFELKENEDLSKSNLRRPKRSCAGNVCYNYDALEKSPVKKTSTRKSEVKTNVKSKKENKEENIVSLSGNDENEVETGKEIVMIVDLDSSVDVDGSCKKENSSGFINDNINSDVKRKLAPIFLRSTPKPAIDPAVAKARHDFLMSGCPEEIKLEQKKRRENQQKFDETVLEVFPKISHIKQFTEVEEEFLINLTKEGHTESVKYSLKSGIELNMNRSLSKKSFFKMQIPEYKLGNHKIHLFKPVNEIEDKREYIKELKITYGKFPTYRCYNQLREKYKNFSASDAGFNTQQVSESFVVTKTQKRSKSSKSRHSNSNEIDENIKESKPPNYAPNGELLFTEKYKPLTSEQILVNLKSVGSLKEFLSAWQNGNKCDTNAANISLDEFELTNDSVGSNSSNQFHPLLHNTVVLLGPNSSGKTNAVFALANELNFDVLEVNSSMKRNGKKLLQDLQEATQSHLVCKNEDTNSIKKTKNKMLKNCIRNIGKKNIRENDTRSSSTSSSSSLLSETNGNSNQKKLCLILFEDADIVFDEDSGFIDAIYQLTSTSKRPVILTATDSNCPHLSKLINQYAIRFSAPNVLNISKYLSILSLIENCPIDIDDIISLYLYNNCNLRKTLLELQFFIQSGGDRERKDEGNHETKLNSSRENERRIFDRDEYENDNEKLAHNNHLDVNIRKKNLNSEKIYIHKTLFEFYTVRQNVKSSIPFPINFDIFWRNINEIFQVSQILNPIERERTVKDNQVKDSTTKKENDLILMENLANFYENTSVAVNLNRNFEHGDRLHPNLPESISHNLIERSLRTDLGVGKFAYNLFDETLERQTLSDYMTRGNLKGNRIIALDYEPSLRSICRSEKARSTTEIRRSRFYHYLRGICIQDNSFSKNIYEDFCTIFTK